MTFYFGTNFKMFQTHAETRTFVEHLAANITPHDDVQLFLIPPYSSLGGLPEIAQPAHIWIGAQNMHFAADGEFTGEISAQMLQALNVDMVMLGHAERRKHFGETDEALNKKVHQALAHGLRVLLCVGENADHRHYGIAHEVVASQLKIALYGVDVASIGSLMIAYEPVWSIGVSGTPATPDQVLPIMQHMRKTLQAPFGDAAQQIPILYGGSINETNCQAYAQMPEIDGLFVGRAVRQVEGFLEIFEMSLQMRKNSL